MHNATIQNISFHQHLNLFILNDLLYDLLRLFSDLSLPFSLEIVVGLRMIQRK